MLVYNITSKVLPEIEAAWKQWHQQEYIPAVMESGQFTEYKFYRLLEQEEEDGATYVTQYFAASLKNYEHYREGTASLLHKKAIDRWGHRCISFQTIMELVN